MTCRGIRGATGVSTNYVEDILRATRKLLEQIVAANGVEADDIAGVVFTATADLSAAYPAQAAREMGWTASFCGTPTSGRKRSATSTWAGRANCGPICPNEEVVQWLE